MKTNKPKVNDQWELKFLRESRFMPFGSLMNAYGNINSGKGVSIKKFLDDATLIAEFSQTLIEDSLKIANEYQNRAVQDSELPEINPEGETISTKQQKAIKLGQNWQEKYNKESELNEIEIENKKDKQL